MNFRQEIEPPSSPLPIAIIGAGGIVRHAHLPVYQKANFKVMGIYDIDPALSATLKSDFSFIQNIYHNLEDLIRVARKQNAVFDIAVPANHLYSILEKLPLGSVVLMQKPMGETLEEAILIEKLCKEKEFISAVNFQLKYAPYMLAAKDIIERNLIGEVFDIELKVCVHTPWELWDFLKVKPRLEILYHSIHYVDLIRSFLGNPYKVYASTIKHPKSKNLAATRSSIILDYDELTQARILTNHGHNFGVKHQESYLKIEGSKGAIKILIGLSLNYPKGLPPKMEYITETTNSWEDIPLIGGWFPDAFIGPMAELQNHYFNRSIPLVHNTSDALQTMELVELLYESSDHGGLIFKHKEN